MRDGAPDLAELPAAGTGGGVAGRATTGITSGEEAELSGSPGSPARWARAREQGARGLISQATRAGSRWLSVSPRLSPTPRNTPQRAATYRNDSRRLPRPQVVERAGNAGDPGRGLKILVPAVQSRPSPPISPRQNQLARRWLYLRSAATYRRTAQPSTALEPARLSSGRWCRSIAACASGGQAGRAAPCRRHP